jgi:hypothetical protein
MKHLIGIEVDSLNDLENLIKEYFCLNHLKYNSLDEQFEGRQGKMFFTFNVCHVYEDETENIEESFYIESIREEIRE